MDVTRPNPQAFELSASDWRTLAASGECSARFSVWRFSRRLTSSFAACLYFLRTSCVQQMPLLFISKMGYHYKTRWKGVLMSKPLENRGMAARQTHTDEQREALVRKVCQLRAEGCSWQSIAAAPGLSRRSCYRLRQHPSGEEQPCGNTHV